MRSRPRSSATPNDENDNARRRQPFRPLQPLHSPPTKSTPPREVFLTPRATPKPIKRRQAKRTTTKVKSEPRETDLSKVRPPSPSEDPLLLSGPRSPLRARFTPAFSSSPSSSTCADVVVPFVARLSGARISPDADGHALPMFSPRVEDTGWSDSDDDELNLTGEYTGKYKMLKVPTKAAPTCERRMAWGRPVSPFPYSEIMERSLPKLDMPEEVGQDGMDDGTVWEAATEPPLSDVEPSSPASEDEFAALGDLPLFDVDAESTQVLPPAGPREGLSDSDQTVLEEQEEEAQIDRELSVAVDDGPHVPFAVSIRSVEDESSDEEDDVREDIIKITSGDPKAAARAAAILRMHDYDCILAAEKKRRARQPTKSRKRRKTIENAGISKSCMDLKSQRWPSFQGVKASPGSLSLPLLELWRDAEDSVFFEHHSMSYCNTSFSLSPLKTMRSRPAHLDPFPTGEWNRDCWKSLDKCLTAERLAVAAARGLGMDVLAGAETISTDAVLDRFVHQLGGESVLADLGPGWSRDDLILRLDVLVNKARSAAQTRGGRHDSVGGCYSALLQEAKALERTSTLSDSTVVPDARERLRLPDLSLGEGGWRAVRTLSTTPERVVHPKDQVVLRHASPEVSIPVPKKPRRLVDLRHLSPTKADGRWVTARRSGGCSVKDLVRQYENLDTSF